MEESDPRFQISAARRMLYNEGCDSNVGGHVSVRDKENPDHFYITPLEYFDETLPDRVLKMTMDLKVLEGDWESSGAAAFHAAFYQARPDVQSVIHTHSHWVSILVTRPEPVGMYNVESVVLLNEQVYHEDDGTAPPVYGPAMAKKVGKKSVVLIKNHGAVVLGDSLEKATIKAMALEKAAKFHVAAKIAGGTEFAPAESARGKGQYEKYWMPSMWEAGYRRLRKSDADLWQWLEAHNAGRKVATMRPPARVGGVAKN